ncbi:MAG: hypothetical protein D5R98_02890 [Desulfonatronovibrio sp. MSAO_Bac4]|nr:MAG: hypothetical protein D5R98_02890 [Desulfonatronovibrio sp. MSAO_Bac4]
MTKHANYLKLCIFIFMPALLFFFISGTDLKAQSETKPMVFGVSLDLSGSYKVMSQMQKNGFLLWQKHVNEQGGILGRPVEVIINDNKGSLEVLYDHYSRMLADPEIEFVFCPYSSSQTGKVAELFERYKVPVLASGASAPSLWDRGYKYLFGLYSPADKYSQGFLEIMSMNNRKRLAMFHSRDIFSSGAAHGARVWAERLGMDILIFDSVEDEPHSYDQAVDKAQSAEASVMMMFGYLDSSILMREAIFRADWSPDAYYATVGPVSNEYYNTLKDLAEDTFSTAIWKYHSNLIYPGVHRFNADFINNYNQEPSYHAAAAYAAGQLMAQALNRAGSVNYTQLRDILEKMESFSIIGRYGVNHRGQQIRHVAFITQWQNGELEIVWPSNLSTASPRIEYGQR